MNQPGGTAPSATLHLGTRRYSSWSLRGWLMVRLAGLAVVDNVIPLQGGNTQAVKAISPNGLVPFLEHDGAQIWESLAIAEYCAELSPALWPAARIARAHARAISAEMHAGFRDLRLAMPMNLGRDFAGHGRTPGCLADIARIEAIWRDTRAEFGTGGAFLFGADFNAADAMFAPIVTRFLTYQPDLTPSAMAYIHAVRSHSLIAEWYDLAAAEPVSWHLDKYETPLVLL
ncbi:MAG: glutathione S-transferase [Acidocella sp.]|nr:glutathione S-transferase [Acidocella sp.]